ncbi:MAG: hypothetical protein WBG46_02465 [Nonlabens sp.]
MASKHLFLTGVLFLALISCKNQQKATIKNINTIFNTKDFNIEFRFEDDQSYRLGFREDYVSFFSEAETQRKTISYDDAVSVNSFVQELFNDRTQNESDPEIAIYEGFREVSFHAANFEEELYELLDQLNLSYVPHKKK